jgi:thymidylate synthase (FAD)
MCARTCYTEDTCILTDSGFRKISEVNPSDKVLTYNKETNSLEYERSNMLMKQYDGKIVHVSSKNMEVKVTPDHRMFLSTVWRGKGIKKYNFITPEEIKKHKSKRFYAPRFFCGAKRNLPDFNETIAFTREPTSEKDHSKELKLEIRINDDWITLFGAYISEGHTRNMSGTGSGSYVCITQSSNNELYNRVINALNNIGIKYNIREDSRKKHVKFIHFGNLLYVKTFDELFGKYSRNKHLPSFFRKFSKRQLILLKETLYLGDGTHPKTRHEQYITVSERLAKEIQELFILSGSCASIHKTRTWFVVEENISDSWIVRKNKHFSEEKYNGLVYCPSTKNGIVCVKTNGKIMWCGNCYNSREKDNIFTREQFIKGIIKAGHDSVLENAIATFDIKGISRACQNQIVRHRIGCSYCVESQRYVNVKDNDVIIPQKLFLEFPEAVDVVNEIKALYEELVQLGVPKEDARFMLPVGMTTNMTMTMNFRALRHFLKLRLSKHAQWEIRQVAYEIYKICLSKWPWLVEDIVYG